MLTVLLWYAVITAIGLIAFPVAYRLLPALPGRGYAFSRALGLLLWGFAFWLLSSFGVLTNDPGGLIVALGLLIAAGVWAWRGLEKGEIKKWMKENRRLVITVEALFAIAFVFWVVVRSANPAIAATEKPMELAFINSIMRSPSMPPNDPWLSGYAISYYYFGYVQTAMLATITGATAGEAFTLALALVFSLTALGSYGVVYDLLAALRSKLRVKNIGLALLGPLFMPLLSNAEGFLEILHAKGFLWSKDASGVFTSKFWTWLDIEELRLPPGGELELLPRNFMTGNWWWWRASRVIQDYDFSGNDKEVISEFPMFSFILGDLHPHVLVMPFAFLSIALAFNLFLGGGRGLTRILRWRFAIAPQTLMLAMLVFGGLAFLNIWEFPVHVGLFAAAYIFWQAGENGWGWRRVREFLILSITMGIGAVLLYFPYFVGFASQAGGLIPNLMYPSRGAQLWVMFATLWIPIFSYLIYRWRKTGSLSIFMRGALTSLAIFIALWALSLLLPTMLPRIGDFLAPFASTMANSSFQIISGLGLWLQVAANNMSIGGEALIGLLSAPSISALIKESFARRWQNAGGWITLLVLLSLIIGLLWKRSGGNTSEIKSEVVKHSSAPSHKFALLLILFGAMLVIVPEFAYIRDFFGYRINTIFKFYYQAWLLWGLAAAYGTAVLLSELKGIWGVTHYFSLVVVLVVGLTYTLFGVWDRANGFSPNNGFVVDGALTVLSGEDSAGAEWLRNAPLGVLAEAVGGSYTAYGRISAHSGQPTVLGWTFHESQWRGGEVEKGSREFDIERLYTTSDWNEALLIIQKYDIHYVYIGALERNRYAVNDTKFIRNLTPVFQIGSVIIYEVP